MNTPNQMPPHLTSITPYFQYMEPLIEEADEVMQDFMDRGYDPDIAFNLTDLTLSRYDEKEAK